MNAKFLFCRKKKEKITSFEKVLLRESGMRVTSEHEIVMKDGQAEVSLYFFRYGDGKEERVLEKRAVISEEKALELLNGCDVMSWDSFHGKHPKGVLDGTMFRFEATVNSGRIIKADGSQNFPSGYRDFESGLYKILQGESED